MFIPRQNRNISTKWVKYAEPPGGQSSTEPPNFFIDYDVFQLFLQHIQKRKNLWGWPWNDGTSLKTLIFADKCLHDFHEFFPIRENKNPQKFDPAKI